MPSTSPAVSAPASRTTTMRCAVMNGGLPAALRSAATAASRPSAPARRLGVVAGAGAAGDGDLLERELRIVGAEQLGDEVVDDPVAQRRVATP